MALQPGERLGPYEILEKLGEGGMGQVFKARDTRLGRLVAIKQATSTFGDRFEREARAVAALNHPNICQVYDVGPDYFVMEFLDGRPLAPVESTRKMLDLAVQMADGMAAAHAAGIVHRDLKPDNVLVASDGRLKILDFGVAKAIAGDLGDQATRAALTGAGNVVGTVHYMSPEQARGQTTLGSQSDQFSFGLILYELVTGTKAFSRDSNAETLTAIIREDAPPLPASVPAPLRWIVERLLAKDPADRYDSSRDLYRELKQLRERLSDTTASASSVMSAAGVTPSARPRTGGRLALITAVAGATVAAALTWAATSRPAETVPDAGSYRFTPLSLDPATERQPVWSPDGRTLAYIAAINGTQQVMTREIESMAAVQLTRGPFDVRQVFWSPDGTRVYFMRGLSSALWSVSAVGGEPEQVIPGAGFAALHPRDGRIVFTSGPEGLLLHDPASNGGKPQPFGESRLAGNTIVQGFSPDGTKLAVFSEGKQYVVSYPEGVPREITLSDEPSAPFLGWMPDSRHVVSSRVQAGHGSRIVMIDTETGTARTILTSPFSMLGPNVSPDGTRLAFASGDDRWKLAEVTLADGRTRDLASGSATAMFPSLSPDGTRLAFADSAAGTNSDIREMTLSPSGETVTRTITTIEGRFVESLRWSPDGARVMFTALTRAAAGLMVAPAAGGRALPIDDDAPQPRGGVFSPDGTQIAYWRQLGDEHQLVTIRVGSSGTTPTVVKTWPARETWHMPVAWSPDGQWILMRQGARLSLLASDGSSERLLPLTLGYSARAWPIFSRDGRDMLQLRRDGVSPGRPWKVYATDVASGKERVLTTVGFPGTAEDVAGLSLSPDGTKLYTSYADWPFDIWMLEGFN